MSTRNHPAREEILSLIREGRGMAYVWRTLREKYGDPHGTYGRLVYDIIQDNAASNASHDNPASVPSVNPNSTPTEHHDAIALSNQHSNPSITQPHYNIIVINPPPLSLDVAMVPLATRLNDWRQRVNKGWELGITVNPEQLAKDLGYYDIAYSYRTGQLTSYLLLDDSTPPKRGDDFAESLNQMMRACFQLAMWVAMFRGMGT